MSVLVASLGTMGVEVVTTSDASTGLTGFGATRAAFAAHHQHDPNPKLIPGAAFGPVERDGGDHIAEVNYDRGRVDSFSIHYAPTVTLAVAEIELRKELPPDAKLVFRVRKGECELRQYKSRALARVEGPVTVTEKQKKFEALFGKQVQGLIDVALYSSETGRYNGKTVENVILLSGLQHSRPDKRMLTRRRAVIRS